MATHSSRVGSRNANTPPHEKKKISGGGGGRPRDLILLPRRLCVSCCSRHYIAFRGGGSYFENIFKNGVSQRKCRCCWGRRKKEHWERVYIYRAGSKLTLLADVRGRRRTTRSHHTPSNPHPHCKIPAVIITHEVHSDLLFRLKCLFTITVNHINANLM